jgi:hypothetical protein
MYYITTKPSPFKFNPVSPFYRLQKNAKKPAKKPAKKRDENPPTIPYNPLNNLCIIPSPTR